MRYVYVFCRVFLINSFDAFPISIPHKRSSETHMPPPISKPHASWKPKLTENERESTWVEAAGSDKSQKQHQSARDRFTRKANEDAAEAKNGVGLTTEDITVLKKNEVRISKNAASSRARLEKPGYRLKKNTAPGGRNLEFAKNRTQI